MRVRITLVLLGQNKNMGGKSQELSNLDQLISRHKEALRRIEELKGKANKPSLTQKLASHWRTHGNALSSFLFAGCFVALASNLVAERQSHQDQISKNGKRWEELCGKQERLQARVNELTEVMHLVRQQAEVGNMWVCPSLRHIRRIFHEKMPQVVSGGQDPAPEAKPQQEKKRRKFMI